MTTHAKVNEVLDEAAKIRRLERELNMLRDHHRLFMQGGPSATEVELMEKCDILRTEKELYKVKALNFISSFAYKFFICLTFLHRKKSIGFNDSCSHREI